MSFHYASAWHDSAYPDVIGDGCGCLLAVETTVHTQLMDFLIKS